jgi:hypothetical protein
MISVVVCSRSLIEFKIFKGNVAKTIGVAFELIRIDNETNKYSICEAYNLGIEKSKYEHICFCHEDVDFKTLEWGKRVLRHLIDNKTGLIGVAGTDTFSNVPNGWWVQSKSNTLAVKMEQGLDNITNEFREFAFLNDIDLSKSTYTVCKNVSETEKTRVVVMDGFWLCCRKRIFQDIEFDENLLTGFHGYDIDICLSSFQLYDNFVVGDVLLEHKSVGETSKLWVESTLALASKWNGLEVVSVRDLSACQKASYKSTSLFSLCNSLGRLKYDTGVFRRVIREHYSAMWLFYNFKIAVVLLVYFTLGSTGSNIIHEFLLLKHKWKKSWSQ